MATYKNFEDLPVWKKSAELAAEIFAWTDRPLFRGKGDLANQLQRSTLSISNNIAEGFERGSTNDLLKFLYIARGSAGESRSMLLVIQRMKSLEELSSQADRLIIEFNSVSRQIRGWANSLQNSEIAGQRHFNDQSKQDFDREKKRSKFLEGQQVFKRELEERVKRQAAEEAEKKLRNQSEQ